MNSCKEWTVLLIGKRYISMYVKRITLVFLSVKRMMVVLLIVQRCFNSSNMQIEIYE